MHDTEDHTGIIAAADVVPGMRVRHEKHGTYVVRHVKTEGDTTVLTSVTGGLHYYWSVTPLTLAG